MLLSDSESESNLAERSEGELGRMLGDLDSELSQGGIADLLDSQEEDD